MISIGVRVILIIFRTSRQSQGCVSGTMAIFALALLSVNAGSAEAGRISPSLSMASPAPTNGTCEPNERYKEGLAAFQRKVRFPYHGYCLPVFRVLLHMAGARTFSASSHSSLQFKWAMHEARRMIERQNEMDKVREARLCVWCVCHVGYASRALIYSPSHVLPQPHSSSERLLEAIRQEQVFL